MDYFALENTFIEEPNLKYIKKILAVESEDMAAEGYSGRDQSFTRLRKVAIFGPSMQKLFCYSGNYDPLVRHYAATYFDNYVSRMERTYSLSDTRFIIVCCAVLAWKMRNPDFKLGEYLREHSDKSTEEITPQIHRMELEILTKLEWRMEPITSLSFLDFFIHICNIEEEDAKKSFKRFTIKHSFPYMQRHIAFTQFKPSIAAASGLLLLSAHTRRYPNFYKTISSCEFVEKGELDRCISIMALYAGMEIFKQIETTTLTHAQASSLSRTAVGGSDISPANNNGGAVSSNKNREEGETDLEYID